MTDPVERADIDEKMFQSALAGIRKGRMEYENDPLLPILSDEIMKRTESFKGLSAEEESKLLALTAEQKRIITENDKMTKAGFLKQVPKLVKKKMIIITKMVTTT